MFKHDRRVNLRWKIIYRIIYWSRHIPIRPAGRQANFHGTVVPIFHTELSFNNPFIFFSTTLHLFTWQPSGERPTWSPCSWTRAPTLSRRPGTGWPRFTAQPDPDMKMSLTWCSRGELRFRPRPRMVLHHSTWQAREITLMRPGKLTHLGLVPFVGPGLHVKSDCT